MCCRLYAFDCPRVSEPRVPGDYLSWPAYFTAIKSILTTVRLCGRYHAAAVSRSTDHLHSFCQRQLWFIKTRARLRQLHSTGPTLPPVQTWPPRMRRLRAEIVTATGEYWRKLFAVIVGITGEYWHELLCHSTIWNLWICKKMAACLQISQKAATSCQVSSQSLLELTEITLTIIKLTTGNTVIKRMWENKLY